MMLALALVPSSALAQDRTGATDPAAQSQEATAPEGTAPTTEPVAEPAPPAVDQAHPPAVDQAPPAAEPAPSAAEPAKQEPPAQEKQPAAARTIMSDDPSDEPDDQSLTTMGGSKPDYETTNITLKKLIDGVRTGKGFTFGASATGKEGRSLQVSPDSDKTNPNGIISKYTVKAAAKEIARVTFAESLNSQLPDDLKGKEFRIGSVQCGWAKSNGQEFESPLKTLSTSVDGNNFTVVIPEKNKMNKQEVLCEINNEVVKPAPVLTLVKTVDNSQGGSKLAADFLLSAAGPGGLAYKVPVSTSTDGLTGAYSQSVEAGTFTLSEKNLDGYIEGTWSCVGKEMESGKSLTSVNGDDVTCSITNTSKKAEPPSAKTNISLQKLINGEPPGKGFTFGAAATGDDGRDLQFSPASDKTNPLGRISKYTVHTGINETVSVTFTESLND